MGVFFMCFLCVCLAVGLWFNWCTEVKRYRLYVDEHDNQYSCPDNVNGYPQLEQIGYQYHVKIIRGWGKGKKFTIF